MKLLVIGAGIGQVPIIEKAKRRGLHVAVVSPKGNYPGLALADTVFNCDIYDRERIVDYARDNGIEAVISDQNDLTNPTVAYVAEKLGLPGNTFAQVMAYCNKNTYRENCDHLGVPAPKHIAVDSENFDPASFDCPLPWIVKPADSQSSVGVKKIERVEDLAPALQKALQASKTGTAILEKFFTGQEVVCEGFIENGKFHLLSFADRKYFDLKDLMIPTQTLFPSVADPALLEQVLACETAMAKHVNPAFGIVHAEYLINPQTRQIRAVESALRGGGVYRSSHLIPYATGIDINDVLLDKALGLKTDVESVLSARQEKAAGYVCFYLPEGIVQSIEGADTLVQLPFVKMACLDNIYVGQASQPMLHKGLRKGPILVTGENRKELEENIQKVQNTLRITVRDAQGNIAGIRWA